MKEIISVRAPATTANLGPGFDCLGLALDIWNETSFEIGHSDLSISGEGENELVLDLNNLLYRGFAKPFEIIGRDVPAVSIKAKNEIPVGRGLGSSAAAIVSGLIAGDKATGIGLSHDEILTLAAEMEGHADNVGPALLGGLQIVVSSNQEWVTSQVPIPKKISLIIFIPDKLVLTSEARSSLPEAVTLDDAKFNIGRASLFVNSMAQGDIDHLGIATQDRLHQDYRAALLPGINSVMKGALSAGADCVFISGSGPSVIAISEDRGMTVCYEMRESASKAGVHGEIRITQPSLYGASLQVINK
tara:strand:- start:13703 stop:14611 length:909 start_codon:yes stop_codon:yes gene_type:complete